MANVSTNLTSTQFIVKVEYWDNQRAKDLPKRIWEKESKVWIAPFTKPNAMYLRKEFGSHEISEGAQAQIDQLDARREIIPFPKDHDFGEYLPKDHQMKALNLAWSANMYALFFEMRLGKSYTAIQLAKARYHCQQVERLLIFCPTPIKSVWEGEIAKFIGDTPLDLFVMEAGQGKRAESWMRGHDNEHLQVLVMGVEALSQGGAYSVARQFCLGGVPTMCVLDESSRIKNFKSKRTEKCCILGGLCEYRLILTGTPVTQGIHDLYSQFEFLHQDIIGQKSFYTFRNRYMIMGGFEGRQIMGYRNSHELMQLVEPYTSVVKKGDVYDVPEQDPQTRMIKPSAEQKRQFLELKHLMRTLDEDGVELEAKTMLERMTRFQQINGGNFPYADGEKPNGKVNWSTKPLATNPKLEYLEEMLDELGDLKVIIWARFVPEIREIAYMLEENNKKCVTFYGATSPEDRVENIRLFQEEGNCQFFVGNQATGGMGIKLSEADVCIYYSNTFSYEDRKQSMARPESMEMTEAVLYIDLVLDTVIDRAIMLSQQKKGGMAEYVNSNLQEIKREVS